MAEFVRCPITGHVYYATDWLYHEGYSCHYYVMPDGRVIRSVPEDKMAWHAKGVNSVSVGVDFLVAGVRDWFEFT
jgi:N-acetyl-anhydromuramyl-L-alanine amidase AmpD